MFANARKHALYYSLRGVLLDLLELVFSTVDVNGTLTKCLLLVRITSGADLKDLFPWSSASESGSTTDVTG